MNVCALHTVGACGVLWSAADAHQATADQPTTLPRDNWVKETDRQTDGRGTDSPRCVVVRHSNHSPTVTHRPYNRLLCTAGYAVLRMNECVRLRMCLYR